MRLAEYLEMMNERSTPEQRARWGEIVDGMIENFKEMEKDGFGANLVRASLEPVLEGFVTGKPSLRTCGLCIHFKTCELTMSLPGICQLWDDATSKEMR